MRKYLLYTLLLILFSTPRLFATTWDEPWAEKVIKEAQSFVLAEITGCDPEKGARIRVLKTLA